MHVSAKADYALRAAVALAATHPQRISAASLAESYNMPRKFLEAVLSDLRRASIVRSTRGAEGGYTLAREPHEIAAGEVLRAIDGPLSHVHGMRPDELTAEPGRRLRITLPAGVQVDIQGTQVSVKGPKGSLQRSFSPVVSFELENGQILVQRKNDEPMVRALHGTSRAVLQNMVTGVSTGFTKILEIDGVGYRAEMDGQKLVLYLGYSHPVVVEPPDGISFEVDTKTRQIKVMGHNAETVGQTAADIRMIRPPEPYKGKGVHYLGERIRRKAGKAGKGKGGKK